MNRFIKKLGTYFGSRRTAKDIIAELQSKLHADQEVVRMRQLAGWQSLKRLSLEAVIELDAEQVQCGVNPEKFKEEIRSLYAWRNAIIGFLTLCDATEKEFVTHSKELESLLKRLQSMENGPLSPLFHGQGGASMQER